MHLRCASFPGIGSRINRSQYQAADLMIVRSIYCGLVWTINQLLVKLKYFYLEEHVCIFLSATSACLIWEYSTNIPAAWFDLANCSSWSINISFVHEHQHPSSSVWLLIWETKKAQELTSISPISRFYATHAVKAKYYCLNWSGAEVPYVCFKKKKKKKTDAMTWSLRKSEALSTAQTLYSRAQIRH